MNSDKALVNKESSPELPYQEDFVQQEEKSMVSKSLIKYVLIIIGSISLTLGIVGVVIPILPTTPFLLLASFCYVRSSNRLYNWLINHKVFGAYIYNYMTYKAVKRSTKAGALILLWISLGSSIFIVPALHLKIFLCIIGITVSIHILKLKTLELIKSKETESLERNRFL